MKIKTSFSGINYLKIYLPYGCTKNNGKLRFLKISDNGLFLEDIMKLYIKEEYHKKTCAIEISFPAKFQDQSITKAPSFFYRWNNDRVTIKKIIATYDIEEIKTHAESLIKEAQLFYVMYCV